MDDKNEYFIPINEVSKRLDVPAYTLRYWEKQFPGAVRPVTGSGNRRYYRADTVETIETIKSLLYDRGMTIAGVKKILHNGTFKNEKSVITGNAKNSMDIAGENQLKTQSKMPAQHTEISPLDMGDIDAVIKLLTQAKMFLD